MNRGSKKKCEANKIRMHRLKISAMKMCKSELNVKSARITISDSLVNDARQAGVHVSFVVFMKFKFKDKRLCMKKHEIYDRMKVIKENEKCSSV